MTTAVDIPNVQPGFGLTEAGVVVECRHPGRNLVAGEMHGHTNAGALSKWYVMGRWASGDADIHRTSVDHQGDGTGYISTDTFFGQRWRLAGRLPAAITLYSKGGHPCDPDAAFGRCGCLPCCPNDSSVDAGRWGAPRASSVGAAVSQNCIRAVSAVRRRGEAWCSPTSTEMITNTGQAPTAADEAGLDPSYVDPERRRRGPRAPTTRRTRAPELAVHVAYAAHYGLGRGDPAAVAHRGRAIHQARNPAGDVGVVLLHELDGAGYSDRRAPHDDHRFHHVAGDVIANDRPRLTTAPYVMSTSVRNSRTFGCREPQ